MCEREGRREIQKCSREERLSKMVGSFDYNIQNSQGKPQ